MFHVKHSDFVICGDCFIKVIVPPLSAPGNRKTRRSFYNGRAFFQSLLRSREGAIKNIIYFGLLLVLPFIENSTFGILPFI